MKQSFKKELDLLKSEIQKYDNIVIMGKGPTAAYIKEPDDKTFYVSLKQGGIFLKKIDLLVMTDFSGFYGLETEIKNIRFILCPYYLHNWNERPDPKFNHEFITKYTKSLGFTGTICFVQIQSDPYMVKEEEVYRVKNSGHLFIVPCKDVLINKKITTYGMNKGPGYHKDIIELIKKISSTSTGDKKNWCLKFLQRNSYKNGGMHASSTYNIVITQTNTRTEGLNITHL